MNAGQIGYSLHHFAPQVGITGISRNPVVGHMANVANTSKGASPGRYDRLTLSRTASNCAQGPLQKLVTDLKERMAEVRGSDMDEESKRQLLEELEQRIKELQEQSLRMSKRQMEWGKETRSSSKTEHPRGDEDADAIKRLGDKDFVVVERDLSLGVTAAELGLKSTRIPAAEYQKAERMSKNSSREFTETRYGQEQKEKASVAMLRAQAFFKEYANAAASAAEGTQSQNAGPAWWSQQMENTQPPGAAERNPESQPAAESGE